MMWSFRPHRGLLSYLEIACATYDRPNFCSLVVSLYRGRHIDAATLPASCLIFTTTYDARAIPDNVGLRINFDTPIESSGEWFTAILSSPDATARDHVAVWCGTCSSHDAVHANLLESSTGFLNTINFQRPVIDERALQKKRALALRHAPPCISSALIVLRHVSSLPRAQKLLSRLEELGIAATLLEFSEKLPPVIDISSIDSVFAIEGDTDSYHELLQRCRSVLIPRILVSWDRDSGIESASTLLPTSLLASTLLVSPAGETSSNLSAEEIAQRRVLFDYECAVRAPSLQLEFIPIFNGGKTAPLALTLDTLIPHFKAGCSHAIAEASFDLDRSRTFRAQRLKDIAVSPVIAPRTLVVTGCSSGIENARTVARHAFGTEVEVALHAAVSVLQPHLDRFDLVALCEVEHSIELEKLIRECHQLYLPVVVLKQTASGEVHGVDQSRAAKRLRECADGTLSLDESTCTIITTEGICPPATYHSGSADREVALSRFFEAFRNARLPSISIVTVLYRKAREIPFFLESLRQQSYRGEVELIVVDDCSPDDSVGAVKRFYDTHSEKIDGNRLPTLTILRNQSNIGNCGSRNKAIAEAKGDLVVIVDADCLLNRDFLQTHADGHAIGDVEVVIGPHNLESGLVNPMESLAIFQRSSALVEQQAELQDPINKGSFLNCITRNFSIRRSFIAEPLFDELFAYSRSPDSGFGWEDVEMGFRLYKRGARIKFDPGCFSVHVTHESNVDELSKPLRSLKNFRRLLDKHPDICCIARRWVLDTYKKLERWRMTLGVPSNQDVVAVSARLNSQTPEVFSVLRNRPLRVLSYRWHCPHQYEIYKLPHTFTLLTGLGPGFTSSWNYEERPLRNNVSLRPFNTPSFNQNDFDVAILHFDENSLSTQNCNNVLEPDWGVVFQWFMENVTIPKIAICHGTPQFYGQYNPEYSRPDRGQVIEPDRQKMVRYLADTLVVCNSYQAQREWGFLKSKVIWQGFDPTEFPQTTYEHGILSLGRRVRERPIYRGLAMYDAALLGLKPEWEPATNSVSQPSPDYFHNGPEWSAAKFRNYVNDIRRYSLYFNPTTRSPMPRSRGEAMMCGLVPISAHNHDVEMFTRNGWDGFYSNDPNELRSFMRECLENPALTREIGTRARAVATDLFNHDRFLATWESTLSELVGR